VRIFLLVATKHYMPDFYIIKYNCTISQLFSDLGLLANQVQQVWLKIVNILYFTIAPSI